MAGIEAMILIPGVALALMAGSDLPWIWVGPSAIGGVLVGYALFGRHILEYLPGGDAPRYSGGWTRFLPLITVFVPIAAVLTSRGNPHATLVLGTLLCAWGAGFVIGIVPFWLWPEIARRRPGANRP